MEELNAAYWSKRYEEGQTGWDLGAISPPLKAYTDQLTNKNLKILIPGCGKGYEGLYLWEQGFRNIYFADFSRVALNSIKEKNPDIPDNQLICKDFFELKGSYDLILEQTMFCAIAPNLRVEYARKVCDLLSAGGKLIGVLFNREFEGGPPFGGSAEEYLILFSQYFQSVKINDCYNSISPRLGSEVFVQLKKALNE